jgi:hypothetical protein
VERPFRYIRQDFFLGRRFRDLADMNAQLAEWLAGVANRRRHGTTGRLIDQAFADERAALQALPAGPHRAALKLERRLSRDGVISIAGNYYSVPDGTRSRAVDVHALIDEIHIYENGKLIAVHPWIEGYRARCVAAGHRRMLPPGAATRRSAASSSVLELPGQKVFARPLEIYEHIGTALAARR